MSYSLEAGDIIEVTWFGVLFNQRILNIRHYVCDNLPADNNAETMFTALDTALAAPTKVTDAMLGLATTEYTLLSTVYQRIQPSRFAKFNILKNSPGTRDAPCKTPNVAAEIILRTDKTTARTAKTHLGQVGAWRQAGIDAASMTGGVLNDAYLTDMGTLGEALIEVVTDANDVVWTPVLYHRQIIDHTKWTDQLTSFHLNTLVRTQRTRTVGKGE